MKNLPIKILLLLVMMLLSGCGGGGSSALDLTSRASITVVWPRPSRLIPLAANSIRVTLTNGSVSYERLITRPEAAASQTSNIVFNSIVVGTYQVTATAYPLPDGTGTAQALGSTSVTVNAGQMSAFTVTMDSTVASVRINGSASPTANVPTTYSAQALDSSQNLVLVDPSTLAWTGGPSVTFAGGGTTTTGSVVTATASALGATTLGLTYTEPSTNQPTVSLNLNVTNQIGVLLTPSSVTIAPGSTTTINATVVNGTDPNVTWNVSGATIQSQTGTSVTIQAPNRSTAVTVTATSVQDTSRSAIANVTVSSNASVSLNPQTATREVNQQITFTASVSGTSNTGIAWAVTGGATIISSSDTQAVVRMPATTGAVTVSAVSTFDTTKAATSTVTVTSATGTVNGIVR